MEKRLISWASARKAVPSGRLTRIPVLFIGQPWAARAVRWAVWNGVPQRMGNGFTIRSPTFTVFRTHSRTAQPPTLVYGVRLTRRPGQSSGKLQTRTAQLI